MRFSSLSLSLICLAGSFLLLDLFIGDSGILNYYQRSTEVDKLQSNVDELIGISEDLQSERGLLIENPNFLLRYASQVGFFKKNHRLIITAYDYSNDYVREAGRIRFIPSYRGGMRPIIAGISLTIALIVFALLTINKQAKNQGKFAFVFSEEKSASAC